MSKVIVEQKPKTIVEVTMPSTVEIELVQGNDLRHYEIFSWTTSLLISIAVGFWTGYFTVEVKSNPLLASAITFSVLGLGSIAMSIYYRSKIYGRKIKVTKHAVLDDFEVKL
ncbi:MAG: hypothetical protein NTZ87_00430 [Candidatus Nomurabacteria bacterium]|nr:hypothetical protein [Candidatus Nomurabacteria bacterium]